MLFCKLRIRKQNICSSNIKICLRINQGEAIFLEGFMITVAIVTRRLKEGKTYEDFRKAWYHTIGFGVDRQR